MGSEPLYGQLAARIGQEINSGKYARGTRLPSEAALAERFGVSRGTIRQALGALGRRGVIETLPGRGTFVKPDSATGESVEDPGKRRVGMVIPAVARMRIPELIAGAEAELRRGGYTLLLGISGDDRQQEAEQIERFLEVGVSGLLVYPIDGPSNLPLLRRLVAKGVPLVLIDRYLLDLSVDAVVADNIGGAFLAVRYLLETGHERVGFVSTRNLDTSSIAERQAGYRWALEQHGHAAGGLVCTDLDRLFEWPGEGTPERVRNQQVLQRYVSQPDRPDAVFAVNDMVAFQVLEAAEKAGIQVPEDLAIIGFDNLAYPDYGGVPLTTVEQPRQEIGATAARVLLERIQGRPGGTVRVVLRTRLILRRSCTAERRKAAHDAVQSPELAVAGRPTDGPRGDPGAPR
jgi:DNA-binding LacI/PurR family transcriptional regulator